MPCKDADHTNYTVAAASLYTLCSNTRLFTLYWRIVLAYRKEKGVLFFQIFLLLPKPFYPFLLIPSSYSIHIVTYNETYVNGRKTEKS
jgi:hypothetical protein